MRTSTLFPALILLAGPAWAGAAAAAPAAPAAPPPTAIGPEVRKDCGFALGYQLGRQFEQQFGPTGLKVADVDMDQMIAGIRKGLAGEDLAAADEKRLADALEQLQAMLKGRLEKAAQANLEAGKKFLEDNKKRAGVKTTASGLQYEVLVEGKGPKYEGDGADDPRFRLRYEGHLIDGSKFDGDINGEPKEFGLAVVPGFKEALMAMPCGSKWKLFLPPELGYGPRGAAGVIPPNAVLVFEVELIGFGKAAK